MSTDPREIAKQAAREAVAKIIHAGAVSKGFPVAKMTPGWLPFLQEADAALEAVRPVIDRKAQVDRELLDFVTLWMCRLVDGEASASEVAGVLQHYPDAPWEHGRPKMSETIALALAEQEDKSK